MDVGYQNQSTALIIGGDNVRINGHGTGTFDANTDGADTIRSSHITFNNWTVYNGDDSLSMKAHSTDITIKNCKFHNGLGIAMGSIGHYNDQYETIERVTAENIEYVNTLHAFYIKTWTADQNGYPPNGGGGGLGFASGMKLTYLTTTCFRGAAFAISQRPRFSGAPGVGNCTNSEFQVRNMEIDGLYGDSKSARVASLQCSAVVPCTNITMVNVGLHLTNGTPAAQYLCGNIANPSRFNCTGTPCVGGSATGEC
ncbi:hypothetical protein GMDG_04001 [Pseudogymnoascus destructans 20631-21]|uniref:Pectate lyase domain-containing protein n=2 Tax=Pseudogymnoascus destructans TaxID=655981 RepID=L8GBL9_PSED2|nr:hypothetical protein GMDG_04001 [Pseudogymnoascus destructans 20631-21]